MSKDFKKHRFEYLTEGEREFGDIYEFNNTGINALLVLRFKRFFHDLGSQEEFVAGCELYIYLDHSSGAWKIEDIKQRALFDPGEIHSRRYLVSSEETERLILFNSADDVLVKYFNENKDLFTAAVEIIDSIKIDDIKVLSGQIEQHVKLPPLILWIYKDAYERYWLTEAPGAVFFEIDDLDGGIGYLHIKDKSKLPQSKDIIIKQELGGGWYLFVTPAEFLW